MFYQVKVKNVYKVKINTFYQVKVYIFYQVKSNNVDHIQVTKFYQVQINMFYDFLVEYESCRYHVAGPCADTEGGQGVRTPLANYKKYSVP